MAEKKTETRKDVKKVMKKIKMIMLPKDKKNGGKWYKPMTILKDSEGKEHWVLIKFNLDNINVNKFKNKSQVLSVEASEIEPHLFGFKAWQDKEGKYHEPYIYLNNIVSYKEATSNFKTEEPNSNDICFVCDEEETTAVEFSEELPFNDED